MDPDAAAERTAIKIFNTLFVFLLMTGCQNNDSKDAAVIKISDSALVKEPAAVVTDTLPPQGKTIYLTFDDGPNRGTPHLLKLIKEEQVPVTLFLIGQHINGSPGQQRSYKTMLSIPAIEIQNHSYTHGHNHFDKFYRNADSVYNDFIRCADSLHLVSGIVRMPGRNIWRTANITFQDVKKTAAVADTVHIKGLTAVGWDLEWRFNNRLKLLSTDSAMAAQIKNMFEDGRTKTPNHLVLLAHDQTFSDSANLASLRNLLHMLKSKGDYHFQVVSKYPALKKL